MATAHEVLYKYWNYTSFKGPQEKIISAVLAHKNVMAILPTGVVSLCVIKFQLCYKMVFAWLSHL